MEDRTILQHVTELVEEERRLLRDRAPHEARLRELEEQLDQCWDLLRQRRALREFGENPDQAAARDIRTVEHYQR
jgi:hypothetical protein